MILNHQAAYAVDLRALRAFVQRLKHELRLGGQDFNLCLVSDREMERLNAVFRGRPRPTDVLSFPWKGETRRGGNGLRRAELRNFLGDVAISTDTARRNARREGHAVCNEIRWLVLHGVLHLLGHDHERDQGEMTRLELVLREQLGIAGSRATWRLKKRARGRHG